MNLSYDDISIKIEETFNLENKDYKVYGVPRGGIPISFLVRDFIKKNNLNCDIVSCPEDSNLIVDDIIDSGKTKEKYSKYNRSFYSPYNKLTEKFTEWIVFPWEENKEKDNEDIIIRFLEAIGENPKREGLIDTPARVVKSWKELFCGYKQDPLEILSKTFETKADEMVICKDIEFYSMCEHHLLPFSGTVHIGYLPKEKVIGLSKLARVVEVFARRLQIQESMTSQISEAIMKATECFGVGVVVEAKHHCMCSRGVGKQNSKMVTSSLLGKFRENEIRSEFLKLIK